MNVLDIGHFGTAKLGQHFVRPDGFEPPTTWFEGWNYINGNTLFCKDN